MATPELTAFLRGTWGAGIPTFAQFVAEIRPKLIGHIGYVERASDTAPCIRGGVPICTLNPGNDIYRGTGIPCINSRFSYNFDRSVWFTWEERTATSYAGPNGCVVLYQAPPEGLQLLDFWHLDVILIMLFRIVSNQLTPREIQVFQYYTGFGIPKIITVDASGSTHSTLMNYGRDNNLLDRRGPDMSDRAFYNRPTRRNVPNVYYTDRDLRWGNGVYDFDHSSTHVLDQEFGSLMHRLFPMLDGVTIRFSTPSSMHGPVHAELFLFPGVSRRLWRGQCSQCTAGACSNPTRSRCDIPVGSNRKTRKSKRKSRKAKNKKKKNK